MDVIKLKKKKQKQRNKKELRQLVIYLFIVIKFYTIEK